MDAVVPAPHDSDLSVPWRNEACAVARELIAASGRFSERWRFKTHLSLSVRTFARREIVDAVCQEKGEDAARSVHWRIMNGRTDKDVDELQRIATILNPASVIPLTPAPAGRLFDAHWRVSSRHRGHAKDHITVLEARTLAQLVSVIGRRARGHTTQALILSDSLAVILASTKGRSSRRGDVSGPSQHGCACFGVWTLARNAVGPIRDQRR